MTGHFERLEGCEIVGWAAGTNGTPCRITIADDQDGVVAAGVADISRPDLAGSGFGGSAKGFRIRLPNLLALRLLRVRADTVELANSPVTIGPGHFDGCLIQSNGTVRGWVAERVAAFEAPFITIRDQDGAMVFSARSFVDRTGTVSDFVPARFSGELSQACFGRGEVRLSASADGVPFAATMCDLALEGELDAVSHEKCTGWLMAPAAPRRVLEIEIWRNGVPVATGRCDRPRAKPNTASSRGLRAGFEVHLGGKGEGNAGTSAVSLRLRGSRQELFNGPFTVEAAPAAPPPAGIGSDMDLLRITGTFLPSWYASKYPEIAASGADPLEHFCRQGLREGRWPNPYFDPAWYSKQAAGLDPSGNPLVHYLTAGEAQGLRPILYFDPSYYRHRYSIPATESCLGHYLANRMSGTFSPIPEFDADYYRTRYTDIADHRIDTFEHFITYGHKECRNPSATFDTERYRRQHMLHSDENPLLHALRQKAEALTESAVPGYTQSVAQQVRQSSQPGDHFEERRKLPAGATCKAKLLAFYLPQYHSFPQNDDWWGKGFTEWTNVARATPRFAGHYQPRIPRDLGFYTLESTHVIRRQIEMAIDAGIFGFVLYFYWFNGKRLMERPVDLFLADKSLDLPFCLMWANENWTRRWDGLDNEVLIAQDYLDAHDPPLIAAFSAAFKDPRYIRIAGRPLLILYRPGAIPQCRQRVARWRESFRDGAGENPIIIMAQAFGDADPAPFGLDGAVEFPPHKLITGVQTLNASLRYLDPDFSARVYDYDDIVKSSLSEIRPTFPLIKTACPGWDNDARLQGTGLVFQGSSPDKYQAWLSGLVEQTARWPFFGERFVCINAWNEWGEGAYLEPDLHYGGAYLNATGRAVSGLARTPGATKILLVGHDAHRNGAQMTLLNIGKTLLRCFGLEPRFILFAGGKLEPEYAEIGPTQICPPGDEFRRLVATVHASGFTTAIVNTAVAAASCKVLAEHGFHCTLLIHELPGIIQEMNILAAAQAGLAGARHTIFASPLVRDRFLELCDVREAATTILPQGSYKKVAFNEHQRNSLRKKLGIAEDAFLALGAGYADIRKGFDLFLQIWRAAGKLPGTLHMCWVGDIHATISAYYRPEIEAARSTGTFHTLEFQEDVEGWFSAADVFVLSSREDPYPTVVLEAMSAGLPIVAFEGAGGIPDLLRQHRAGLVVELGDVQGAASAAWQLAHAPGRQPERERLASIAATHFDFPAYVSRLLTVACPDRIRISAVVPNYNYTRYLRSRLATIMAQTYPPEEIIVLDDASGDDSLDVVRQIAEEYGRDIRIVANEKNSGSVFRQWRKAAELASADYVWIAEADDESDPRFLERLAGAVCATDNVVLACSDSRAIDGEGRPLSPDYKTYFAEAGAGELTHNCVYPAVEFVRRFLSVKNLILNVSGVIWKRDALIAAMHRCNDALSAYRMAGDWYLYIDLMTVSDGNVAFVAEPLNVHRRHPSSVTSSLKAERQLDEIWRVHKLVEERLGSDAPSALQASYRAELAALLEARAA